MFVCVHTCTLKVLYRVCQNIGLILLVFLKSFLFLIFLLKNQFHVKIQPFTKI